MLNKEKHRSIMAQILKDIYSDPSISSLIGFKGGTASYLFYNLPRFSVDLDFDLLNKQADKEDVFNKIHDILVKYGEIKDEHIKQNTIFFFLSYGQEDRNVKVEISTRGFVLDIKQRYELKNYLGISMLAAKKDYLFASKIDALLKRKETAPRDIYDIYYFAKNNWDIDNEFIEEVENKKLKECLNNCIELISSIEDNKMMQGLGELIEEKERAWIKSDLKKETIFLLKLRNESI